MIENEYFVISGMPSEFAVTREIHERDKPVYLTQYHWGWTSLFPQAATFKTKEAAMEMMFGNKTAAMHLSESKGFETHCKQETWKIMKVETALSPVVITDSEKLKFHIESAKKKLNENELAALKMDMLAGVNLCKCD